MLAGGESNDHGVSTHEWGLSEALWKRAKELKGAAREWQEHKQACPTCREWRATGYICPGGREVIRREAAVRARLFKVLDGDADAAGTECVGGSRTPSDR